jgi:hypothetical protein
MRGLSRRAMVFRWSWATQIYQYIQLLKAWLDSEVNSTGRYCGAFGYRYENQLLFCK